MKRNKYFTKLKKKSTKRNPFASINPNISKKRGSPPLLASSKSGQGNPLSQPRTGNARNFSLDALKNLINGISRPDPARVKT